MSHNDSVLGADEVFNEESLSLSVAQGTEVSSDHNSLEEEKEKDEEKEKEEEEEREKEDKEDITPFSRASREWSSPHSRQTDRIHLWKK